MFAKEQVTVGRTPRHAELPRWGMEPAAPAVEARRLNQRTAREVQPWDILQYLLV